MQNQVDSIVLIDDDPATNFIHEKVIEDAGCAKEVNSFLRGSGALEYMLSHQEECSRLIFLDINMPGMGGWEFVEELGKHCESIEDHCVIIMLSTSLNPDDKRRANEQRGVAGFHNKPLTEHDLEGLITKHFVSS